MTIRKVDRMTNKSATQKDWPEVGNGLYSSRYCSPCSIYVERGNATIKICSLLHCSLLPLVINGKEISILEYWWIIRMMNCVVFCFVFVFVFFFISSFTSNASIFKMIFKGFFGTISWRFSSHKCSKLVIFYDEQTQTTEFSFSKIDRTYWYYKCAN